MDLKKWTEINKAILYDITMAPIATVEHGGFKHPVEALDKRYTVPV